MINVQMGQQDVNLGNIGAQVVAHALDARTRIEDNTGVAVCHLNAGSIAPVGIVFGAGRRQRSPASPNLHSHGADFQNMAIAPRYRSGRPSTGKEVTVIWTRSPLRLLI